jgi:hypothetical protein
MPQAVERSNKDYTVNIATKTISKKRKFKSTARPVIVEDRQEIDLCV